MRSTPERAEGRLEVPPAFEDGRRTTPASAPDRSDDPQVRFDSLLDELGRIRDDFEQLDQRVRARA